MSNHSWAWRKGVVVGAAVLMLALPTAGLARQGPGASQSARSGTGSTGAPSRFTADWQSKPPTRTPEEVQRLEAAEARTNRPGPTVTQTDAVPQRFGPEAPAPNTAAATGRSIGRQTPDTLTLFRDTIIPGGQVSAGGSGYVSNTQEPSIGANGKYNFQTGNWYATRTVNNGASWQYLDPFAQFGGTPQNFCCDQVALYEPGRNLMFWLLMGVEDPGSPGGTGNHLQLAVSAGNDLVNWCSYDITPAWFGEPLSSFLDYNDMISSNNFLWIANNPYPAAGGNKSGMLRMPLDALAACAGFGYNFVTVSDWFNFKPVQGATEVMYWASVTPLSGPAGAIIRIYRWAENNPGTYSWDDRAIPAFTYMSRNAGQNCAGGPSGQVNNWCNYADSRSLGGYLARGVLAWSWNAKQDGTHPKPYTRLARFAESTRAYLNSSDYMSSAFSLLFMTWSPNARGHVAATFAWGGGTTNIWYPGTGLMIQDDFPSGPGSFMYLAGGSNACASNGITARWGDYLTIRPWFPSSLIWIAVGMRNMNGGPCTAGGRSEVRNFVLGRERDLNSYNRWKNS